MKKKFAAAALSLLMVMGTTATGFSAGSVGHGNISVFQGGQLIDKLSGQNPIAESSLLVCDGKCMVKSEGISLVAADQAKFAIQNEDSVFNLFVRVGKVDYVINDNSRKIAFHTPDGSYSVAEVVFNASSSSVVRGSVQVSEAGKTEIAVTEGRLIFATADGMKTVDANHKIVLAIADVAGAGAGTGLATGGGVGAGLGLSGSAITGLAIGGALFVGATVAVVDGSGADGGPTGGTATTGTGAAPAATPAFIPVSSRVTPTASNNR